MGSAAHAQAAPGETSGDQVAGNGAQENLGMGEDIVVTARKSAENLQKVPIAVTAVSGAAIESAGVRRFSDIQALAPSLTITRGGTNPNSPMLTMRGQSQNTLVASVDPSVAVYVDGVYQPLSSGLMAVNLRDLDRVEVLRGVQGTLYGRNATGGAINFFSRAPVDRFEGRLTAGFGNYGAYLVDAMLNAPLAEGAALRIVGGHSAHKGYSRNVITGGRGGDAETSNLRVALRLDPTDDLSIVLRADWAKSSSDVGLIGHPLYLLPGGLVNRAIATQQFGGASPDQLAAGLALYNAEVNSPLLKTYTTDPSGSAVKIFGGSATIAYDLGDTTITSITGLRRTRDQRAYDVDSTNLTNFYQNVITNFDQFTQELQLSGKVFDDKVKYTIGGFYLTYTAFDSSEVTGFPGLPFQFYQFTRARVDDRAEAIFAQADWEITTGLSLTGGLRYSHEVKKLRANAIQGATAANAGCSLPALGVQPGCFLYFSTPSENLSYNFSANYQVNPALLLYARTGRGYKSGFVNQRIIGSNPRAATVVLPEQVTDYEVGIKSELFDRRLRLNVAVYDSEYKNIQRASTIGPAPFTSVTANAASGRIKGFEVEATAALAEGLSVNGNLAYTDAKYLNYFNGTLDQSFLRFPNVSKWTYLISGKWSVPLPFGRIDTQLGYEWRSSADNSPPDAPGGAVVTATGAIAGAGIPDDIRLTHAYGLVNAALSLHVESLNTDFQLTARNLTNKKFYTYKTGTVNSGIGVAGGVVGDPRVISLEATIRF